MWDWLIFHDYKLAIEIDENGHSSRSIYYEIKRQKVIGQELGCEFLRINPDKKDFDFLKPSMKYLDTSNNRLINWLKKSYKIKFQWDY